VKISLGILSSSILSRWPSKLFCMCTKISENQSWFCHNTGRQWRTYEFPEAVKIQFRSSWWWAKISLETCRTIKRQ
jgi:hypothetical protein